MIKSKNNGSALWVATDRLARTVAYRDLFYFFVSRDIKTRYAQSILHIGWAVIQRLFTMIVFSIVFGNLPQISSDGVPYAIFSYTALVPWSYFSSALSAATSSLINASGMISKVYFPGLVIPKQPRHLQDLYQDIGCRC